jgi:hypothetical protein
MKRIGTTPPFSPLNVVLFYMFIFSVVSIVTQVASEVKRYFLNLLGMPMVLPKTACITLRSYRSNVILRSGTARNAAAEALASYTRDQHGLLLGRNYGEVRDL